MCSQRRSHSSRRICSPSLPAPQPCLCSWLSLDECIEALEASNMLPEQWKLSLSLADEPLLPLHHRHNDHSRCHWHPNITATTSTSLFDSSARWHGTAKSFRISPGRHVFLEASSPIAKPISHNPSSSHDVHGAIEVDTRFCFRRDPKHAVLGARLVAFRAWVYNVYELHGRIEVSVRPSFPVLRLCACSF